MFLALLYWSLILYGKAISLLISRKDVVPWDLYNCNCTVVDQLLEGKSTVPDQFRFTRVRAYVLNGRLIVGWNVNLCFFPSLFDVFSCACHNGLNFFLKHCGICVYYQAVRVAWTYQVSTHFIFFQRSISEKNKFFLEPTLEFLLHIFRSVWSILYFLLRRFRFVMTTDTINASEPATLLQERMKPLLIRFCNINLAAHAIASLLACKCNGIRPSRSEFDKSKV